MKGERLQIDYKPFVYGVYAIHNNLVGVSIRRDRVKLHKPV